MSSTKEFLVSEDPIVNSVFDTCRRLGDGFGMRELVGRLVREKPELLPVFPKAWIALVNLQRVRVRSAAPPYTYEVVDGAGEPSGGGSGGGHGAKWRMPGILREKFHWKRGG